MEITRVFLEDTKEMCNRLLKKINDGNYNDKEIIDAIECIAELFLNYLPPSITEEKREYFKEKRRELLNELKYRNILRKKSPEQDYYLIEKGLSGIKEILYYL